MIKLKESASEVVAKSVLITGAARTGTTMIYKVIHSCEGIEASFEPPALYPLFHLLDHISRDDWKLLYESYLFYDFLTEAVAGRHLNLRKSDDSSIHKVKSKEEIINRFEEDGDDKEIFQKALKARIAYKMVSIIPQVKSLLFHYPKMKVVMMIRNPADTIASLLGKGWFGGKDTAPWSMPRLVHGPEMHYNQQYGALLDLLCLPCRKQIILVDYDQCVANSKETTDRLFDFLGLVYGSKTRELIREITPQVGHSEKEVAPISEKIYQELLKWV